MIKRVCPHNKAFSQLKMIQDSLFLFKEVFAKSKFSFTNVNCNWLSLSLVKIKYVIHFAYCMKYIVFIL